MPEPTDEDTLSDRVDESLSEMAEIRIAMEFVSALKAASLDNKGDQTDGEAL